MAIIRLIKTNHILAITIGIVYLWFGTLKFFPLQSPAESLAQNTIDIITLHLIPKSVSIILLALLETLIGIMLILNIKRRLVLKVTFAHIILTFIPLFAFSEMSFSVAPYSFTLLGQYIFKNIIIIAALITLYKLPDSTALRRT
ncbi:DoxX family membrane protein [Hyunsoonleella aestuarii]|uniref:Doxx family protein n=1 Tax=Hyunsoonleella aestuarii TaxID=912802 RepID=A0ABP8E9C2_9FLAO|nr:DoxX family membrane protein [Hyunsoonleella aestuarii]